MMELGGATESFHSPGLKIKSPAENFNINSDNRSHEQVEQQNAVQIKAI